MNLNFYGTSEATGILPLKRPPIRKPASKRRPVIPAKNEELCFLPVLLILFTGFILRFMANPPVYLFSVTPQGLILAGKKLYNNDYNTYPVI